MMPVAFRGYAASDLEAMYRLDKACFAGPFRFSRSAMRQFAQAKNALVVLAESAEQIAGFCIVHVERLQDCKAGYVVTLDVAEDCRRMGLGGQLMQRVERSAQDAGCSTMLLHVFCGNEGAIRFYERNGYERSAAVPAFYGRGERGLTLDAWLYRKNLAAQPG